MVRIRLRRMGAKKHPFYRLVVADAASPRDGRCIEEIGFYNPTVDPHVVSVREDRAMYWLKSGAQPSATARAILSRAGVLERLAHERARPAE